MKIWNGREWVGQDDKELISNKQLVGQKLTQEEQKYVTNRENEYKKKESRIKYQEPDTFGSRLSKVGNTIGKTGGTILNTEIEVGKGIVKGAESFILDPLVQLGSSKYNPFMHLLYNGKVEDGQKIAQEIIQKDATKNFIDNVLGYNKTLSNGKTVQQTLDDSSYVRSDNLGGQIARAVGNMLPSVMVGNAGAGQLGATLLMVANAYGGGLEEAYNEGANRTQANLYGLGNAAIETATEYITGGIPGVKKVSKVMGKMNLDSLAEKGLEKVSNKVARELLNAGYKMVGEGTEEALSEILKPYLKNATYSKDEKIDWNEVLNSAVVGAITGGILEGPTNISNIRNAVNEAKILSTNKNSSSFDTENNIENKENLNYNIDEGDLNDRQGSNRNISINEQYDTGRNRGFSTDEEIQNSISNNDERNSRGSEEKTIPTSTERREYFERIKNNNPSILTKEQSLLQEEAKNLGIDLQYFIGEDNGDLLGTTDNGKIHLDVNPNNMVNENSDLRQRFYHELFHNIARNNDLNLKSEINDIKNNIVNNDSNSIKEYLKNRGYDSNLFSDVPNLNLAEEVLADYSAKHLADYDINYKLSPEIEYRLNTLLDDAVNTLKINNMKHSNIDIKLPTKEDIKKRSGGKLQLRPTTSSTNDNTTNSTKSQMASSINNMQQNEKVIPKDPTKESSYDDFKEIKKTRKEVQQELQDEMGITIDDISAGKDISNPAYQRTDPIRVNEKVFGAEIGKKINDATINKTKHNEAERIRFLNKERNEIKNLGIKPRSKESAAVQKYGEKQYINDKGDVVTYSDTNLAAEFPNIETQQKIKRAAEVIRNKYDKYINTINETITELGYDPIPKRKDYMRHFQELNDKFTQWGLPLNRQSLNENNIPTDINGLTDQFKPGKNWFASAMQRKGLKTTYDAITGIDGYLDGASNLMYHTEDIQRYRALSKLVRDTFGQTHGLDNVDLSTEEGQKRLNDIYDNKLSKYAAWLDEQANALAGKKGFIDRGAERVLGRKIYSVLDAAKKQVGSNMTGFNVRSALTNFASAVQGASKTNKLAFIKGTLSTVKNIVHNDGLINKSDFLTSRLMNDSQLSKKFWQKASNAGQIFMSGTDYFTANQIWRSKYYENLSKGMSEVQAIKNADDFASRIMGDRSKGATAEIFNSKTLGLLTQFQLEVNNQWSSMIHDNKMDIKNGNKVGASVVFQLGQLAAMSYLFNNLMKSLTGSDVMFDPIDILMKIFGGDDDKSWEDKANDALGNIVDNLPMANIIGPVIGVGEGGRIPVSEALQVFPSLFGGVILGNEKDKYGNKLSRQESLKNVIESAAYWALPTGYGQAKKTIKGLSMYDSRLPIPGSYTNSGNLRFRADESTSGKIKAALFGQYSSEEAQKYREDGYKAISKSRLQEVKDLNMSSSEYRKYRENLNQAGTTNADKIEYIANSNYTDNQKNIMAKNVLDRDFDIKEYEKYDSYDEYNYAYKNPEKYSVIKQITSYDKYNTYVDKLTDIRNNTSNDKEETIKYINTLPLSIPQKAMFIKQYYKSYKKYDKEIVEYVKKNCKTKEEREQVLSSLGFKVKDGRVYY